MKYMLLLFVLILVIPAEASDRFSEPAVYVSQTPKKFMVSGVLRKGTAELSIRLVHSIHAAATADEALGIFTREVIDKFPGYSVLTTLVSQVEQSKSDCGMEI